MEDLFISDPTIMIGKPVIIGTRITVESIIEKLAAGETIEQSLEAHPRLTKNSMDGLRDILTFIDSNGEESHAT